MAKHINVRYSLTESEVDRLNRVQLYLQKKLNINKVSQTDAFRHMLNNMEATMSAEQTPFKA